MTLGSCRPKRQNVLPCIMPNLSPTTTFAMYKFVGQENFLLGKHVTFFISRKVSPLLAVSRVATLNRTKGMRHVPVNPFLWITVICRLSFDK